MHTALAVLAELTGKKNYKSWNKKGWMGRIREEKEKERKTVEGWISSAYIACIRYCSNEANCVMSCCLVETREALERNLGARKGVG